MRVVDLKLPIDHRRRHIVERTKSSGIRLRLVLYFFVLSMLWRHLWYITAHTRAKTKSICYTKYSNLLQNIIFKLCSNSIYNSCDFEMNFPNFEMNTASQLKQKDIEMVNQKTKKSFLTLFW